MAELDATHGEGPPDISTAGLRVSAWNRKPIVCSAFLDDFHTHQPGEVVHILHVVAIDNDAVQQRHSVLRLKNAAPVGGHLRRITDFGDDLCATAMDRLLWNFDDLAGRGKYGIQVDQLGAGNGLANAVLDLGDAAAAPDLGMPAQQVRGFLAIGTIHLQRRRAVRGPQSIARSIEGRVALEPGAIDRVLKQEHRQQRVHVPLAGRGNTAVAEASETQAGESF